MNFRCPEWKSTNELIPDGQPKPVVTPAPGSRSGSQRVDLAEIDRYLEGLGKL